MQLLRRYIYALSLLSLFISAYYSFSLIFKTTAPIHVRTRLLHELGHDIQNANLCQRSRSPKVFIGVISAPKNYEEREAIRTTWGNISLHEDVALAFFVGKSLNADVNRHIKKEALRYSDIVRSNNVDSYMNLTLKTISLLEWTYLHCPNVRFVMKCDDDVYVNVTNLLSFVNTNWNTKMIIYGELGKGLKPLWWPPRWYVSSSEYDKPKYPDFLFGPAYLISSDCLGQLYTRSLETEFFRLEDVFLTGIVAESLKIERVGSLFFIRRYYTKGIDYGMNFNLFKEAKIRITINGITPSEQTEIWNSIQRL